MILSDRRRFILENTRLQRPPHVPELQLHLADEITPIWRMTEEALAEIGVPPPYWAFAWAGGQGIARYLLDHPSEVRGLRVLDFASGSGLCALASLRAGAASALAADLDPFCAAAVVLNGEANQLTAEFIAQDLLSAPPPSVDVILAGDVFYERPLAEQVLSWLGTARDAGARVLLGDPGRSYFPKTGLRRIAEYRVPVTRDLEDYEIKRTGVFTFP